VASSPGGVDCGSTCSHAFDAGTQVTLTASPSSSSSFAGWSGGGCSGKGTCTVTLNGDISVTATFSANGSATPPNTQITSHKVNKKKHSATFAFKASGTATGFQCSFAKRPKNKHKKVAPRFRSCTSPKTYKHLTHGHYLFEVRALGPAGPDPSPAHVQVKL
jgi:hypothetical protein